MNHINKLLRHAKRLNGGRGKHILGFVEYDHKKQKYRASGTIWDGVPGSGGERFTTSDCSTLEEAQAACEAVAASYPNAETMIFYYDYGEKWS